MIVVPALSPGSFLYLRKNNFKNLPQDIFSLEKETSFRDNNWDIARAIPNEQIRVSVLAHTFAVEEVESLPGIVRRRHVRHQHRRAGRDEEASAVLDRLAASEGPDDGGAVLYESVVHDHQVSDCQVHRRHLSTKIAFAYRAVSSMIEVSCSFTSAKTSRKGRHQIDCHNNCANTKRQP